MQCDRCKQTKPTKLVHGNTQACEDCIELDERLTKELNEPAAIEYRINRMHLLTAVGIANIKQEREILMTFEKHADFFAQTQNETRLLIADMTLEQKEKLLEEISKIVIEYKVKELTVSESIRQQKAKNKVWTSDENTDVNVEGVKNAVESRKKRISKEEKLAASLLGILGDDAKGLIDKINKKATDSQLNVLVDSASKAAKETKQVTEESKPFEDFDSLF